MNLFYGALLLLIGRNIQLIRVGLVYRWFLLAFWICLAGFALTDWASLGILCGVLLVCTVVSRLWWRRKLYADARQFAETHIRSSPPPPTSDPELPPAENYWFPQDRDEAGHDPAEFIAMIPAFAESHVAMSKAKFNIVLDYSEESLTRIDEIVTAHWDGAPILMDDVVRTFGSYVGETIRRLQGGAWVFDPEFGFALTGIGGSEIRAYPFSRIYKRFLDDESIADYYRARCKIIAGNYGPKSTSDLPTDANGG
jgi:hypothetical protein